MTGETVVGKNREDYDNINLTCTEISSPSV